MFNLFKSNKCCNGGTEHNFQPRYDRKSVQSPLNVNNWGFDSYDLERILDASKNTETKYIKDVCVWCGKEIPR